MCSEKAPNPSAHATADLERLKEAIEKHEAGTHFSKDQSGCWAIVTKIRITGNHQNNVRATIRIIYDYGESVTVYRNKDYPLGRVECWARRINIIKETDQSILETENKNLKEDILQGYMVTLSSHKDVCEICEGEYNRINEEYFNGQYGGLNAEHNTK